MSFDVNRLRAMASNIEDRKNNIWIIYPIITGFCFFVGSYVTMPEDIGYLNRALIILVGLIFGRMFGTIDRHNLEERYTAIVSCIQLYEMINKPLPTQDTETLSSTIDESIAKVEIPAEPNLPNIPSIAVPAGVKEVLQSAKTKGKPTRLPPKRKIKSVPPVSQA